MFSDFDAKAKREAGGRGRRSASLVIAGLIFAGLAGLISAAIATAHAVIERRQRDVEVEFAALEEPEVEPEPEPEPPPPPPPRPRARLAAVIDRPPDAIPDERPPESEGELAEGAEIGSEWGEEGGTETAPPRPRAEPAPLPPPPAPPAETRPPPRPPQQERIEISAPRMLSGCQTPERPPELETSTAETITIYVRLIVSPDGSVMSASIEESHPLVPDETVLACIRSRIYEPAKMPDGTPVPFPLRYAFTYRPDVL
jgi:hypothetical protein